MVELKSQEKNLKKQILHAGTKLEKERHMLESREQEIENVQTSLL